MRNPEIGKLLDEITFKMTYDKQTVWEEKLGLWLRPRPHWIPVKVWAKIVALVLFQTSEKS